MRLVNLFAVIFAAVTSVAFAHDVKGPVSIKQYSLDKVSPSIYVVHGAHQMPNPKNRGFMNNQAAILTPMV